MQYVIAFNGHFGYMQRDKESTSMDQENGFTVNIEHNQATLIDLDTQID